MVAELIWVELVITDLLLIYKTRSKLNLKSIVSGILDIELLRFLFKLNPLTKRGAVNSKFSPKLVNRKIAFRQFRK